MVTDMVADIISYCQAMIKEKLFKGGVAIVKALLKNGKAVIKTFETDLK